MQERTNLLRNFDIIISSNESNKLVENSLWNSLHGKTNMIGTSNQQLWKLIKTESIKIYLLMYVGYCVRHDPDLELDV